MINILIVGKESYIGESLNKWLNAYECLYCVDIVSPLQKQWKSVAFSKYQVVINLAGIAHISNITEDMRDLFYAVNCDLAYEIGAYAKACGVRHFIQFSSMNVYGDFCGEVTNREKENPTSFYGDSKLQGDSKLISLICDDFCVACIRPPFVYGKGCKGNYNAISKLSKRLPFFLDYKNKKSMIYIDNLCEFVRLVIDNHMGGILTPQNRELVSTVDLMRTIAECARKKIIFTKLFNWAVPIGKKMFKVIRRAFEDDCYSLELSGYFDYKYCVVEFSDSVKRTES